MKSTTTKLGFLGGIALAMSLTFAASTARAAGEYVWWEAETADSTTFPTNSFLEPSNATERDALSGADLLASQDNAQSYNAQYTITVPVAGNYKFYVRNLAGYGPFQWRFDSQAVQPYPSSPSSLEDVTYKQFFPLSWYQVGTVNLSAGQHTFRFDVSAGNTQNCGYDAFLLSIDPFVPRGKAKPDQRLSLSDPGRFAFESLADPFNASAALNLRSLNETVAGQAGRVRKAGDDFQLGNGTPVRFWGVTTSGSQDLDSLKLKAKFLAKRGVNLVRYHTTIASSDPSNINAVDPAKIDDAKRLVAAMKAEGIYTKLSVFFVLGFTIQSEWGVDGYTADTAQPFAILMIDPQLKSAYKQWLSQLLTSANPYTGQNLASDPAVALIEIQNEDSFFFWTFQPSGWPAPQQQRIDGGFGSFLTGKYGSIAAARAAWGAVPTGGIYGRDNDAAGRLTVVDAYQMTSGYDPTEPEDRRIADQVEYLTGLQRAFYTEMRTHLRSIGYQGLIESSNWTTADERTLQDVERYSYQTNDVIDKHQYFNSPHTDPSAPDWSGFAVSPGDYFSSTSALKDPRQIPAIYKQSAGFPSIVSESTWTSPNLYQAEAPLTIAAYSSLTDVDGFIWFATGSLGYDSEVNKFPVATPSLLGQFPGAALMYRRGDIAETSLAMNDHRNLGRMFAKEKSNISESTKYDPNRNDPNDPVFDPGTGAGQVDTLTMLTGKVETTFDNTNTADTINPDVESRIDTNGKIVQSLPPASGGSSQLRLDYGRGILQINSPRAQGVSGFLSSVSTHTLSDVTIATSNPYGSILVVSLDGKPLATSDKILLQAMSDAQPYQWQEANQNFSIDGTQYSGKRIVSKGRSPWNVANINATVTLKGLASGSPQARVLDENGYDRGAAVTAVSGSDLRVVLPSNSLYTVVTRSGGTVVPPPTDDAVVQLAATNYSGREGQSIAVVVNRTVDTTGTTTVNYTTVDASAIAGQDYTATSGTLSFAPGETSKIVNIPLTADADDNEPTENFRLNLTSPVGGVLGTRTSAVVSIGNFVTQLPVVVDVIADAELGKNIRAIKIVYSKDMNPDAAAEASAYAIWNRGIDGRNGEGKGSAVKLQSVTYDSATRTTTITPKKPLKRGKMYHLWADGMKLPDTEGRLLDGTGEGSGPEGYPYQTYIGRGGAVTYVDEDGDKVTLKLAKGEMTVTRSISGNVSRVLTNAADAKAALTGTLKPRKGTDGVTHIGPVIGLPDNAYRLEDDIFIADGG